MILLIRHCSAEGQEPEAKLTEKGKEQAVRLAKFISEHFKVTRIITSPFLRAIDSVKPLAEKFDITIECDELLRERYLCENEDKDNFDVILEHLKRSFEDFDYKACVDGESNRDSQNRALKFLRKLRKDYSNDQVIVIVSHGNLSATLLNLGDSNFGYEQMMNLTNPDIFTLKLSEDDDKLLFKRVWNSYELDIASIKSFYSLGAEFS